MRRRRWAAVVAVFIIAILPLSFLGLKIASHHPSVKRAVLSRIVPDVEGQLSVGELGIGLASLSLGDVLIDMGERGSVRVPSATVSLRYPRLLARGLEVRRALGTVIMTRPTIVIRRGVADTASVGVGGPPDLRPLGRFLPDYLGVSDGTVVVEDAASGRRVEITSLDLFLEKRDAATAVGDAVGDVLGGSDNVTASLTWDLREGALSANADVTSADLSLGDLLPLDLPFDADSGTARVRGSGTLVSGDGLADVDVTFDLEAARFILPRGLPPVAGVSAAGSFDGDSLKLQVGGARWDGSSLSARGILVPSSGSLRHLKLRAEDVSAALVGRLAGGLPVDASGLLDVEARVNGSWPSLSADVYVRADSAVIADASLSDVSLRATVSETVLVVDEIAASWLGGDVRASGVLTRDPADTSWAFDVEARASDLSAAEIARALGGDGWSGTVTLSDLRARGSDRRTDIESLVTWSDLRAGPVALGSGAGGLLLRDGAVAATFASREGYYAVSGEIDGVFADPVVDAELTLTGLRVDSLLAAAGAPELALSGAISAAGPAGALDLSGVIAVEGRDASGTVAIEGFFLQSPSGPELRADVHAPDAVVRGVGLPLSARIVADTASLSVSGMRAGGVGEANVEIGLAAPRTLRGSAVVSEASLRDVCALVFGVRLPDSVDGLVFASGSLGGTVDAPQAQGQIQIGNGRAFGVAGLDAVVSVVLEDGVAAIREAVLRDRGESVLTVSGTAGIGGDLALSVRGEGMPGPLLGGGSDSRFDLTLGIGGKTDGPTLDGVVEASHGEFLGVAFDEFSARFTGAESIVQVDPLRLKKTGLYTASAAATVPLAALAGGGAGEGTLSIEVDGDPLSFLAEIVPFASRIRGSGRMRASLVGRRGDVTVASAQLTADASSMRPSALLEDVEDLSVDVSIVDGVVQRGRVSGRVEGNAIRVESGRGIDADGRVLEPLMLGGVDAGVLAVSTDPAGVRAAVPGLMQPGDVGRVAVRGKGGAPTFLIGGPGERPLLWGEMEFSDVSFTYPLLESDGGFAGGLFSRSEWSMRMTAGRNLWYVRPDANIQLVRGGALDFIGVPDEGTLCVSGRVESKRGRVTYANTDFDVREVSVDFPLFCEPPRFLVEAETRVEDGTTISLTMESFEGAFASGALGATLDEGELRLTSDSPEDNTQEKILAKLQYGVSYELLEAEEQAALDRRRAVEVIGSQLSGRIVRPLLSPVEGRMKRSLKLDLVRFDIDFLEHFLGQLDLWQAQEASAEYQPFLADSRVTLGKYISRDWLLSYVGYAEAYEEELGDRRLGLRHEIGVEYEVSRNTSISMRAVYDPSLAGWDRRISIENRYSF